MWKNLGTVINPKKCRKLTVIDKLFVNGKFVTDKQLISDGINNFFSNIGNSLQSAMIDKGDAYTKYLPPRLTQSFYLTPVDEEEIKREIKNMNPKKSPGHHSIGAKIIQWCPDIFAENLCEIYIRSIENKCYPDALNLAKVTALYKKVSNMIRETIAPSVSYHTLIKSSKNLFVNVWNIPHSNLSVLKVEDIFNCNVLSFANESRSNRCPDVFKTIIKYENQTMNWDTTGDWKCQRLELT